MVSKKDKRYWLTRDRNGYFIWVGLVKPRLSKEGIFVGFDKDHYRLPVMSMSGFCSSQFNSVVGAVIPKNSCKEISSIKFRFKKKSKR